MSNDEIGIRLDEIKAILTRPIVTDLLTAREAAIYCKVSIETIYQRVTNGMIAFSKPGMKNMYFKKEDLDEYLNSNKQEASPKTKKAHRVK